MMCLALGLGALGFWAARKARRCGRGGFHYRHWGWHHGHHGHHGHHAWHGRWGGPPWARGRAPLYMALAHIDASPAQERAIIAEVDKLHERLHGARASLKDARGDLAGAFRGSTLDDAALGAVLGRVDAATGDVRSAFLDALRTIHGVLDDRQRAALADLLEQGGGWRGRGYGPGGPYRV